MKLYAVRLPEGLLEEIHERARNNGDTVARYFRRLLRYGLLLDELIGAGLIERIEEAKRAR